MNKKSVIIANIQHPLYKQLSQLPIPFYHYKNHSEDLSAYDLVYDFTVIPTQEKIELLKGIDADVISDLSCNWGELVCKSCPNVKVGISTVFYSPNSTYEVFAADDNLSESLDDLFSHLKIKKHNAATAGFGFVFARTLAQIINEAYFALDDGLALDEAIDTAMKFGVNYPIGPIEWSHKIDPQNVQLLLNELFNYTGDPRYRAALSLQKASL